MNDKVAEAPRGRTPAGGPIGTMSMKQFRRAYAWNERRRHLYHMLLDELVGVRSQCTIMRVLVFGSYITSKEEPGDIDVLIGLIPTRECAYAFMTTGLVHRHPDDVDVTYHKTQMFLQTAEQLVRFFNNNPLNQKKHIALDRVIELTDA